MREYCSHPLSGAAGELVGMGLWEKRRQRQLHSRGNLPPFWVPIAAQGAQLRAHGENKVFTAFQRSLQYFGVCAGIVTGDPRDAEQTEGGEVFGCGANEGAFR